MKLCILGAGKGTRNKYSANIPKGLLPVKNRPLISHFLDPYPVDAEIVMAVGHQADVYRDFFKVAYPERKVVLVNVDQYEGTGAGPGFSLLSCQRHLQGPFYLLPTDAFINGDQIFHDHDEGLDWIGLGEVERGESYCLVEVDEGEGTARQFIDKPARAPRRLLQNAFTGVAHISDYQCFFDGLRMDQETINGETQVTAGFRALANRPGPRSLHARRLKDWRDTGTTELYLKLATSHQEQALLKTGEMTFLMGKRVLKYHSSEEFIDKKVRRGGLLGENVPQIDRREGHFFSYPYIEGNLLARELSPELFLSILKEWKTTIFRPLPLDPRELGSFFRSCLEFYQGKTSARLREFFHKNGQRDAGHRINGMECPSIEWLLSKLPWDLLSKGIPTLFHGDLQPENIVIRDKKAYLLDWRHEFTEGSVVGDLYYDLAKLKHALLVSGEMARGGHFRCQQKGDGDLEISYTTPEHLQEFDRVLDSFIVAENLSLEKTHILAALVYLNIAPLYDGDYGQFLFFLGKLQLTKLLTEGASSYLGKVEKTKGT